MKLSVKTVQIWLFLGVVYAFVVTLSVAESSEMDVSGKWETSQGTMVLKQKGKSIEGTYEHDQGYIKLTISGKILKGRWSERPTYEAPDDAGEVEFTLSDDGESFSGRWRYGATGTWQDGWTGKYVPEEDSYWQEERPGKKDDCSVSLKDCECNEVVYDGKEMLINTALAGIPGAAPAVKETRAAVVIGKDIAKKCLSIGVGKASEASGIMVHRSTQCNCELIVEWSCKYKKVLFKNKFLFLEDERLKDSYGYYKYSENRDERGWVECTPDDKATCQEFCEKLAAKWRYEYAKKHAKIIYGKSVSGTKSIPGWKGLECDE